MGKSKKLGQFRPFIPNSRADMRRVKQYRRNREFTDRHEEVMAAKRELQQIQELERIKRKREVLEI